MRSYLGSNFSGTIGLVGLLKLWPVRFLIIGWFVMAVSITMSVLQTGNFLFEYGPDSGRPEIVTPYFKVVATALFAQIGLIGARLAWNLAKR
jgi:hypothetical protein